MTITLIYICTMSTNNRESRARKIGGRGNNLSASCHKISLVCIIQPSIEFFIYGILTLYVLQSAIPPWNIAPYQESHVRL